jgi:hypothetical protein
LGNIPVEKPEFQACPLCGVKNIGRGLVSHLLDIKAIESKVASDPPIPARKIPKRRRAFLPLLGGD